MNQKKKTYPICDATTGITLVALVVTIVVLLILAGITITYVFGENSIFKQASRAKEQMAIAKAREKLELTLNAAQIKKYESGLTDKELDNKIAEIEGELLLQEKPNKDLQNVIVDGYIFEIDRSVPKIVDYISPADGVIILATITGNGGWVKPGETVSVTGIIKTYSGGTITSSTATVMKGNTTITDFPATGGNYTIANISEDTDIKITAIDSKGKKAERTINVVIKRDNTAPVLSNVKAEAERMKIKISAIATDDESGINRINYSVTPTTITPSKGTFASGQEIELTASEEKEYTITFTATDNSENTSDPVAAKATTINGITIAQAKELINKDNLKDYIGTKIIDYEPASKGVWRVYYYDAESEDYPNGYFGTGGALYIKRDYDESLKMSLSADLVTTEATDLAKKMNPKWGQSTYSNSIDQLGEQLMISLFNQEKCNTYLVHGVSQFGMLTPSVELFSRSYSAYYGEGACDCKLDGCRGYGWAYNMAINGTYGASSNDNTVFGRKQRTGEYLWHGGERESLARWTFVLEQYLCLGDHRGWLELFSR